MKTRDYLEAIKQLEQRTIAANQRREATLDKLAQFHKQTLEANSQRLIKEMK